MHSHSETVFSLKNGSNTNHLTVIERKKRNRGNANALLTDLAQQVLVSFPLLLSPFFLSISSFNC